MATKTVWCTPTEVARFGNRIHVRTLEQFDGVVYFAVPATDAALADHTVALASSAIASGDMLLVTYDPADISGVLFGCQDQNCRTIQHLRLSTHRRPYVLPLEVDGEARRALIYPSVRTPSSEPSPAVFYFHGRGGDVYDSAGLRLFHSLWPEAVVVYAEASRVDARGLPSNDPARGWQLRFPYKHALGQGTDLAYVARVLSHVRTHHNVDASRVYAAGHSSGGFFTFSLTELMPHAFAKFAVLGAYARFKVELVDTGDALSNRAAPLPLAQTDHATLPRPVLYMFGKHDVVFDQDSPSPEPGWHATQMSRSRRTILELARRNGCPAPSGQFWTAESKVFTPASQFAQIGAPVHWRLYDGDHGWPAVANDWVIDFFRS